MSPIVGASLAVFGSVGAGAAGAGAGAGASGGAAAGGAAAGGAGGAMIVSCTPMITVVSGSLTGTKLKDSTLISRTFISWPSGLNHPPPVGCGVAVPAVPTATSGSGYLSMPRITTRRPIIPRRLPSPNPVNSNASPDPPDEMQFVAASSWEIGSTFTVGSPTTALMSMYSLPRP